MSHLCKFKNTHRFVLLDFVVEMAVETKITFKVKRNSDELTPLDTHVLQNFFFFFFRL